jgi:hypothetical protein
VDFNFNIAQTCDITIYDIGDIPLSQKLEDNSDPNNIVPIDITNYKFLFYLRDNQGNNIKNYFIDAGVLSTVYLVKTGTNNNILDLSRMLNDVRNNIVFGRTYKLLQSTTDTQGNNEVYAVINIHAKQY